MLKLQVLFIARVKSLYVSSLFAQKYWQKVAVHAIAQFCRLTYGQCFPWSYHVTASVTDHSDKQTLEKGKLRIVTGASFFFFCIS